MRPIGFADLSAAARALLALPPVARARALDRMLDEAAAADRYRRRMGRRHPLWGNGSLEAAARAWPLAPPRAMADPAFQAALAEVLDALLARRGGAAMPQGPFPMARRSYLR